MNWQENITQYKEDFDRDGYVVLKNFIDVAEVQEIDTEIERFIADVLPTLPAGAAYYETKDDASSLMRLQKLIDHDDYFHDLYYHDRFTKLAASLLGDEVVGTNLQLFNKPPHIANATPPHQDGFYFMLEPNEAITLWLAHDACDDENGCIRYIPGSHRRDMRPHRLSNVLGFSQGITDFGDADRAIEAPIHCQVGDLICHHSMIIHRADSNPSKRRRRALGFVYYAKRAKKDDERAAAYQQELLEKWKKEGKV